MLPQSDHSLGTEYLPKFRHARVEDTGDTHLLDSLTSATIINTNFALDMKDGYTWLTDRNSTDHSGRVALFNTSGFVTDVCLTVGGIHRYSTYPLS
jgi:hypothetical protein